MDTEETIEIIGWHGGWGCFDKVDSHFLGSGEGSSQGRGFYFAEHRAGGEYFARYFSHRKNSGYLYKVKLTIDKGSFWENADNQPFKAKNGGRVNFYDYHKMIRSLGASVAAYFLLKKGVKAFNLWETDKPPHGYTFVVLDHSTIETIESYKYIYDPYLCYWDRIK